MKTFFQCVAFSVLFSVFSGSLSASPLLLGSGIDFTDDEAGGALTEGDLFGSLPSLNTGWVLPPGDLSAIAANPETEKGMGLKFAVTNLSANLALNVFADAAQNPLYLNDWMDTAEDLPVFTETSFQTVFTPSDILPDPADVLDALGVKILMCALEEDDGLPFLYVTRRVVDEYGETMTNGLMRTGIRVETDRVYTVLLQSKGYRDGFWKDVSPDEPGFVLYRLSIELDGVRTCVTEKLGVDAPDSIYDFDYTAIGDWVFGYSEDTVDTRQYRQLCFFGTGFVDAISLSGEETPAPSPEWRISITNPQGGSVLKGGVPVSNGQVISGADGFSLTVSVASDDYRVEIAGDGVEVVGSVSPYSVTVPAILGYKVLSITFIQESSPIPPMPDEFADANVPQGKYEAWYTEQELEGAVSGDSLGAYLLNISPDASPMPTLLITSISVEADSTITITVESQSPVDLGKINGYLCVILSDDLATGFDEATQLRYTTLVDAGNPATATISGIPMGSVKRFVRAVITVTDPGAYVPVP